MKWVWGGMLGLGLLAGMLQGDAQGAADALVAGAGEAVSLCVSLAGAYMLWMGLMRIAEEAGLVKKLSRAAQPVLRRLFPGSPGAVAQVTLNLCANFFGLGSAATPFGLAAMKEMEAVNDKKGVATDDMCMFLALNSSAIELLPATVLALRASAGSADVYRVVAPTFLASVLSAVAAVALCKLLAPLFPR